MTARRCMRWTLSAGLLTILLAPTITRAAGPYDTYTVPPCRVVDTRVTAQGQIPAGGSRSFIVAGDTSTQGGAVNCNIPDGLAKGVYLNIVAVAPSAPAWLTVYPYPSMLPLASTLNFDTEQTIANGVLVPICDATVSDCTNDITVTMGPAAAHIVIDVMGYLLPTP